MKPVLLSRSDSSLSPSQPLLTAALSGLLGLGLVACGNDDAKPEDEHEHENPDDLDSGVLPDAAAPDAETAGPDATVEVDAGSPDAATGPIVTKEIPGIQSYAALKARCDQEGGYVQLHAACSGANTCKGFSYGDWAEESVLSEHTCASMNGCTGLSCVYLPADSGKTGKDIYEAMDLAPGGPQSCTNCHAVWSGHDAPPDLTKFKVWVLPGSTRLVDTWPDDVAAAQQEGIVAFGIVQPYIEGTPTVSMKGYHKLYSRAEIQRVVAYIREELTPIREEIGKPE